MELKSTHLKIALQLVAWATSIGVLVLLRLHEVPLHVALLVIASYLFWFALVQLFRHHNRRAWALINTDHHSDSLDANENQSPADQYYRSLVANLEANWTLLDTDYDRSVSTVDNVHKALEEAVDLAGSTGMLALNAMIAATDTGEVGRGFVTVSKDLVAISEQSIDDLNKIKHIVAKAANGLGGIRALVKEPAKQHLVDVQGFPYQKANRVVELLQDCQGGLRGLSERYQRTLKSDVRWLQMGDAVRRLLNELINTLYQLELRLSDVLADLHLLKLSGSIDSQQLLEIQDGISTIEPAS